MAGENFSIKGQKMPSCLLEVILGMGIILLKFNELKDF
jgi:hypothetical protein